MVSQQINMKKNPNYVSVDGHKMNVFIAGDENKNRLVFMSGSGTIAPVYDFKILYKKLIADYRIIVVEKYCKITVVEKRPPVEPTASIEKAKVTGLKTKTWTGSALKQSPVVKLSGKTLKSGTDYTVSYKNNKNVGKATLTITGKGKYTGKITKTFKIRPKGTSIAGLNKARKAVKVKWKKQAKKMSGSRITGYQIQLATNSKFTKNKRAVTVRGYSKVSRKVKGLKAKRKYYVRVRTYKIVKGVKYYSSWSKVRTVKTR